MMHIRDIVVFAGLALILAIVNWQIAAKERVLRDGELLLLELGWHPEWPRDGRIIVANDADGVARFVRLHVPGTPLGAAEHLLRYRRRGGRIRIGPNAFFFQEGQADRYRDAHYGELRVDDGGECLLVGLRDRARQRLGPTAGPSASSEDLQQIVRLVTALSDAQVTLRAHGESCGW